MNKIESIEINDPVHIVLLENEPILTNIERSLQLEPNTVRLVQRKYLTCNDETQLNNCMNELQCEVKKYTYAQFKVKISTFYNEELVLTHLRTLGQYYSLYRGLKFYQLPVPSLGNISDYIVYSLHTKHDISEY